VNLSRRGRPAVGFAAAALLVAVGGALLASSAAASPVTITGNGILRLDAGPVALSNDAMQPGDRIYWPITVNLNAASAGHLSLRVLSSDALVTDPAGLRLALASCPVAWEFPSGNDAAPSCGAGASTVIPETPFASVGTEVWNLGDMPRVSSRQMVATISLPDAVPSRLQGAAGTIQFGFTALGTTVMASPNETRLAFTGLDLVGPALLAAGLLLAGITLARLRSREMRRNREANS
jgi:hypothetical protein